MNRIREALRQGVNINAKDSHGITPLMYAISTHNKFPITTEVLNSIGLPARSHYDNYSRAEKAVLKNYRAKKTYNLVKKLINRGANLNATGGTIYPPLRNAILFGSPNIVRLLLKRGARVNRREVENLTVKPKTSRYLYGVYVTNNILDALMNPYSNPTINNFTRGHSLPSALMMRQTGQRYSRMTSSGVKHSRK